MLCLLTYKLSTDTRNRVELVFVDRAGGRYTTCVEKKRVYFFVAFTAALR